MITFQKCEIKIGTKVILKDVTLNIEAGTTTVIEGENGSGKSVLINSLLGLNKNVKGKISRKIDRKTVCYITDSAFFFDDEKVIDVINIIAYFYNVKVEKIFECLEILQIDLKSKKKMLVSQLSKGMQKKLLIVPIFFSNHKEFFLDEIFTGLDIESQNIVLKRLKTIIKDKDKTLVIIEHNKSIVNKIKSMLIEGKVIECENQKIKHQSFL